MNFNDDFFKKVEKKTKVNKKTILDLAEKLNNGNMKDESTIREVIGTLSKMTGKNVSKEKEDRIIDTILKDKASGLRDVECPAVAYNAKRLNDKTEYSYVIIYIIKPEATKKLLSEQEIYNNLLKYYKVKYSDREKYLKELSDEFYTDDRRNNRGVLDLDEKRKKECEKHMHETW